jgi:FKBP-type peptidyl-prolyl cis-trans isomerase
MRASRTVRFAVVAVCVLSLAACSDDSGTDAIDPLCVKAPKRQSGVTIQEIECGSGEEAVPGRLVSVDYTGTLETGEVFDSSVDREPYTYILGEVGKQEPAGAIDGWDAGIAGMKVGGKRKLTIPPALAYGPVGRPPVIPPDATLIFEVELVDVAE